MARILVVEDEKDIAMGLEDDLSLEGYQIEVVGDGITASQRAQKKAFDLIILDLMLPGKEGIDVCRELRRAGLRTPIIILTAKASDAEKALGLDLGADDYVTKPFSPLELRARVKAVLRRTKGELQEIYSFGDCEIDFGRFEVRRDGKPVSVTTLEFKLMAAMISNRGRVLSRSQLLNLVWGSDTFVTDRVVDTHITNLRKKLEPQPNLPRYIVSVRGLGYRFDG